MLNNGDNLDEPSQTAAQARVMPQAAPRSQRGSRRRFLALFLIFFAFFLLFSGILIWINSRRSRHSGSHAAPILRPLSAEPDGKILYTGNLYNDALWEISDGKPASQIIISENDVDDRWTLFKMAGHVYLRGYITGTDSLHSLQGQTLTVYNDSKLGGLLPDPTASKITLRIDKNDVSTWADDLYSEVTVPNFQPDSQTTLNDWR